MADISKIILPNGSEYDLKDSGGRTLITNITNRVTALETKLNNFVTQDSVTGVLTVGGGSQNV